MKKSGERVRLKMNLGTKEGMNPKRILGIINDVTEDKSISVGDIEVTNKYTFFDVFEDQHEKLLKAVELVEDVDVAIAKGSRSTSNGKENANSESWRGKSKEKSRSNRYSGGRSRGNSFASSGTENSDKPWRKSRRY